MKKLRYIYDYYKLPVLIALIVLYIIGYSAFRACTKKDPLLYAALVNVSVSQELVEDLSEGFLENLPSRTAKETMLLATGWYLTDHPDADDLTYTRASQMKILAGIDAEQLDLVFMDREAFDAFSQNGFLYDLSTLFPDPEEASEENSPVPDALAEAIRPHLVTNMEIIEDNAKEIALDESIEYHSVTREYPMGIDLSDFPLIKSAHFSGTVYLGIVSNTPRMENVIQYLSYLCQC